MGRLKVVIVDYNAGNLLSVQRAVEECGADAITSFEPDVIANADRLILPGVGAFAKGMKALESLGLVEVLNAVAENGVPLLGICLGMQLLLSESEEHGLTKGLGIIPGRVVSIPNVSAGGMLLKVPHIGWNCLTVSSSATRNYETRNDFLPRDAVYFVHSYMAVPYEPSARIADCFYGGNRICAVIRSKNVVGCQFHPEKSGAAGLTMLKNWLKVG